MAPGNERQGHGSPKQRDVEPREPTDSQAADSDLRCQKDTQGNISHGRQMQITLVSGSNNQTRRGQSHSRPRTLHRNNA